MRFPVLDINATRRFQIVYKQTNRTFARNLNETDVVITFGFSFTTFNRKALWIRSLNWMALGKSRLFSSQSSLNLRRAFERIASWKILLESCQANVTVISRSYVSFFFPPFFGPSVLKETFDHRLFSSIPTNNF